MFDLKEPLSVINDTFILKNSKKEKKRNKKENSDKRNDCSMPRKIFIFNWGCFRLIIVVLRHPLSCKESAGMTIDVLSIMGFYVEMTI